MTQMIFMQKLTLALDNGNCAIRLSLDFQKACDTVDDYILLDNFLWCPWNSTCLF